MTLGRLLLYLKLNPYYLDKLGLAPVLVASKCIMLKVRYSIDVLQVSKRGVILHEKVVLCRL